MEVLTENAAVSPESSTSSPDGLGKLNLLKMKAPKDNQWYLRKQRPQQGGDNKNYPGGKERFPLPKGKEGTVSDAKGDLGRGTSTLKPGAICGTDQNSPDKG